MYLSTTFYDVLSFTQDLTGFIKFLREIIGATTCKEIDCKLELNCTFRI